jgi:predicted component of viral defense system (DUF524 family)
MSNSISISVLLDSKRDILLEIFEESPGTLFIINEQDAFENGESRYQLIEGKSYEYLIQEGYSLEESEIVRQSKIKPNSGRINTNIYVGSLEICILSANDVVGKVTLEVRSIKTSYRNDYRKMLKDITDKCSDLLLQHSIPIYQTFTFDINNDPQTLYQRFAFVDSIIRSDLFINSIHRINAIPVKRWKTIESQKDISNIRRVGNSVMRQITSGSSRMPLPVEHNLKKKFDSLPQKINVISKSETTDTQENRFVKYVLELFLQFCFSISQHKNASNKLKKDASVDVELLSRYLQLPVLKGVSELEMIPLHSPVLQKKGGYREVLQTYLMFDMAASLIWEGGDLVYKGGKRDVAVLYEYWVFFMLLELMEDIFDIKPKSINELFVRKEDGLLLDLQQGLHKMIDGVFVAESRRLNIEFYYNRTFRRDDYPAGGSWTKSMRPDYTLSIWPEGISKERAEKEEVIVHIHFDAKYKIDNINNLFSEDDHNDEKMEEAKGNYKRADLLKMHAYKDAIRRTGGAYILYPGSNDERLRNFHEIIPGLGAFALSPNNADNTELKRFLLEILQHFLDRTSQRELYSHYTYETFNEPPSPALNTRVPERHVREFPQKTNVLIGYYKNSDHLDWILRNKLYTVRTDYRRGSLRLSQETTNAKYLVLHGNNTTKTDMIFRLDPRGPRVISREKLEDLKYPSDKIQPYYIGYSLETGEPIRKEFGDPEWDVSKLEKYKSGRASAIPFVVTLEELLRTK